MCHLRALIISNIHHVSVNSVSVCSCKEHNTFAACFRDAEHSMNDEELCGNLAPFVLVVRL